MRFSHYILAVTLLAAQGEVGSSYEWKTHNGIALHARRLAETVNRDKELLRFLDQVLGHAADGTTIYELDSRAGDPIFGFNIDEDHSEGELKSFVWCWYEDRPCFSPPQRFPQEFPEEPTSGGVG